MEIKLSIILPFYNVERYITPCLDSLYAQDITEESYEVICINDCSPDHARRIVLQYQQQHSNLRLIEHTENKCLGGARNTGIKAAQGKYIWFVDSDDKIAPNCLKALISVCNQDQPDVIMFNFDKIDINNSIIESVNLVPDSKIENGVQFIRKTFGDTFPYHLGYVWRHLYRNDFLKQNDFFFPENVFWEDTVFMPKALCFAEKVCSINKRFYHYRINPSSVSNTYHKERNADLIFQFSLITGWELLQLSELIYKKAPDIGNLIQKQAFNYLNNFIFKLLRAPYSQQKLFFTILKRHSLLISKLKPYLSAISKFICTFPKIGMLLLMMMTPAYRLKIMLKKK